MISYEDSVVVVVGTVSAFDVSLLLSTFLLLLFCAAVPNEAGVEIRDIAPSERLELVVTVDAVVCIGLPKLVTLSCNNKKIALITK